MKLVIFVATLLALSFISITANSQNSRISLNLVDVSIKEALLEIENQNQYYFLYNNNLMDVERKVNLNIQNQSINEVVELLFEGQNVDYTIKDQLVILFPVDDSEIKSDRILVEGKVVDRLGQALPGVAVVIRGTILGTVTDAEGNFQLNIAEEPAILEFSFIGLESQALAYGDQDFLIVTMNPLSRNIDEVIVVAYGTQSASSLTGSVQAFNQQQLANVTSPHLLTKLQGEATGVLVANSSGTPGEKPGLRIRGEGSINYTNEPLWVVDGVIFGPASPDINPNDIESVSVLKDAAAAALYGSRASNGVIMVRTKTGKINTSSFNLKTSTGITRVNQGNLTLMNGQELYDYVMSMDGDKLPGQFPPANSESVINGVDWQDIAFQNGIVHDYNLSYSGGNEKTMLYTSFGYFNEEGAARGHQWERFSGRVNLDYKASDKLKLILKVEGIYQNSFNNENDLVFGSYVLLPWDNPYFSDGTVKVGRTEVDGVKWYSRNQGNPLYDMQYNYIASRSMQYMNDVGVEYKLTDWLTFVSNNRIKTRTSRGEQLADSRTADGQADSGILYNAYGYVRDLSTSNVLRFNKENTDHSVFGIVAYEYTQSYIDGMNGEGKGIYPSLEILNGASESKSIGGSKSKSAFLSILSNVQYVYKNKYMMQLSYRRDGSSRFGSNQRFGDFYSVGTSWVVTKENFMQSVGWVNNLKLRLSYGSVGNANIADYVALGLYNMTVQYNGEPGGFPRRLPNPDLTWESNKNFNFGVDTRLFDRVNVTVDAYDKRTDNLLQDVPLPLVTGFYWFTDNVGSIQNRGLEFSLETEIVKSSPFLWNTSLNMSFNKNKVLRLNDGKDISMGNKIIREGWDINTWYMRKWAGVDPSNGNPLWEKVTTAADGTKIIEKTSKYSEATLQNMDSSSPKFFGGFMNTFVYKQFKLDASFNFVYGNKIYHLLRESLDNDGAYPTYNAIKLPDGWSRWEKPGDIATHPRPVLLGNKLSNKPSSRYLEDGSYLRLNYLSLSYTLPGTLVQKVGLNRAELKLSGENLWTLSNFSGMDPEVGIEGYGGTLYPVTRKYILGLEINF
ncbi:TonB-linked outer membrane protein, SusC/RagA family [Draconibacterium orientale]|uniref:Membrane protein n=1 Tax=Draconibacterium orientale TaxID=1168034 RepID=X5DXF2_9BACT|nr:SusC/RagA family TonB-linked outer membrane protein [Draconibacterium orientale]AHW58951.1 membrane protein [Draconibacterium orientale]SET51574.1 TonB-linked outer membrane protein, SusC/RagA family [Draconibacterium orientale]